MNKLLVALGLGVLAAVPADAQSCQYDCSQILVNGTKDVYISNTTQTLNRSVRDWLCSYKFDSVFTDKSNKTSIFVAELGLNISNNWKSTSTKTTIDNFCATHTEMSSNISTQLVVQQVASPVIVDAWLKCVEFNAHGSADVQLNVDDNVASTFVLTGRWNHQHQTLQPRITSSIAVSPAGAVTCAAGSTLDAGNMLQVDGGNKVSCVRNTTAAAVLTLTTSQGSQTLNLPTIAQVGTAWTTGAHKDSSWVAGGTKSANWSTYAKSGCLIVDKCAWIGMGSSAISVVAPDQRFVNPGQPSVSCTGGSCTEGKYWKWALQQASSTYIQIGLWDRQHSQSGVLAASYEKFQRTSTPYTSGTTAVFYNKPFTVSLPTNFETARTLKLNVNGTNLEVDIDLIPMTTQSQLSLISHVPGTSLYTFLLRDH